MDNKIVNTNKKLNKRGNPAFHKGMLSNNPNGRPKGSKNYLTLLEEAIEDYETNKGKKLFDRLIERAFINDMVLLNVVKKFIPDKSHTEIEAEFVDKTIDKAEQELERKFVKKLEQDPEYKKRVIEHYRAGKRILEERSS